MTILNDDEPATGLKGLVQKLINKDQWSVVLTLWKEQFTDALTAGSEEEGPPTPSQQVVHIISVTWKVLFACVPPPTCMRMM